MLFLHRRCDCHLPAARWDLYHSSMMAFANLTMSVYYFIHLHKVLPIKHVGLTSPHLGLGELCTSISHFFFFYSNLLRQLMRVYFSLKVRHQRIGGWRVPNFLICSWLFNFFILLCRLKWSISPTYLCFPSHPLCRRRGHAHSWPEV